MGRYERAFPELFELLPLARRWSINAALNDDRLEGNTVRRAEVELLIRSVVDNLSDDEYIKEVLAFVQRD